MHRYATEIVANHFVADFSSTLMMDMHADSGLSTQEVGRQGRLGRPGRGIRTPMHGHDLEGCCCLQCGIMIVG